MSRTYDVIVLGLGGMGSAVTAHLAARGMRGSAWNNFSRRTIKVRATGAVVSSGRRTLKTPLTFRCCYVPMNSGENLNGKQTVNFLP